MNVFSAIVLSGSLAAVAGVTLLRVAWGRPLRSAPLLCAAWALVAAGLVQGAWANGAWGLSIVSLSAMGAAFAVLALAIVTSKPGKDRPSERWANILPDGAGSLFIGRRIFTFLLAVPLAMAAALLIALGGRAVAGWSGWHEANANVLAIFLLPVCWAILAFALLMTSRRRFQAMLLIVPATIGAGILWLGSVA